MNSDTKNRIQAKIFVGVEITMELRMLLNQSHAWKEASVVKDQAATEVHYNEKDYLGKHVAAKMLTLKDLQAEIANVREQLQLFCPNFNVDTLKTSIFPQVFVS